MKSGGAIGLFLFTVIAVAIFFWMTTRPTVDISAVQFGMPASSVTSGEETAVQPEKEEATSESQEASDAVDPSTNSTQ